MLIYCVYIYAKMKKKTETDKIMEISVLCIFYLKQFLCFLLFASYVHANVIMCCSVFIFSHQFFSFFRRFDLVWSINCLCREKWICWMHCKRSRCKKQISLGSLKSMLTSFVTLIPFGKFCCCISFSFLVFFFDLFC